MILLLHSLAYVHRLAYAMCHCLTSVMALVQQLFSFNTYYGSHTRTVLLFSSKTLTPSRFILHFIHYPSRIPAALSVGMLILPLVLPYSYLCFCLPSLLPLLTMYWTRAQCTGQEHKRSGVFVRKWNDKGNDGFSQQPSGIKFHTFPF